MGVSAAGAAVVAASAAALAGQGAAEAIYLLTDQALQEGAEALSIPLLGLEAAGIAAGVGAFLAVGGVADLINAATESEQAAATRRIDELWRRGGAA